jgi:hypothetical protein
LQIVDTFTESLRSKHTKEQYNYQLKRFIAYQKLWDKPPHTQLVDYLGKMKAEGLSYSYRNLAFSAIKHYYVMNDVILNWPKLSKFLGENTFDNTLRGYTHKKFKDC